MMPPVVGVVEPLLRDASSSKLGDLVGAPMDGNVGANMAAGGVCMRNCSTLDAEWERCISSPAVSVDAGLASGPV